jgi:hypothetical protein
MEVIKMKRELKALLDEHQKISDEYYAMESLNSTGEERKNKWLEIMVCREKIASLCCDILGIKTEDQAKALAASMDRGRIINYIRKGSH